MVSPPPLIRDLLDALQEPALLVEDRRTVAANPAARRLLGAEMVGNDVRLAIRHPVALGAILAAQPAEVEVTGIGGIERSWLISVRPLHGRLQLVRMTDQSALRAAEKMRVDFVANASHELRTPLATIVGYAETLAEEDDLELQLRQRFGQAIHKEARRMLRIVEDLMSLSRIEADRFLEPQDRISLAEIVRIAAENGRALPAARGCRIETRIEPDLGNIRGDYAQLLQLLDNLVGNAIRYGCRDRDATVWIDARREGGHAVLCVKDTGDGIPAAHLPRLTERFYRVDDARSRDGGGTGLGLAIVKHIVERHRGRLDIRSTVGQGTEVRVWLPFA